MGMRFNFRRATLPDDAIAAGGCCWEKRGMAFWGNSFSVFFSVRSFIPAVADVRGFLQEDDGGGDGFGDVSDALDGADDEEQVDVEGLLFLCLRSDEAARALRWALSSFLSRSRTSRAVSMSCVFRLSTASRNSETAMFSRGRTMSGARDSCRLMEALACRAMSATSSAHSRSLSVQRERERTRRRSEPRGWNWMRTAEQRERIWRVSSSSSSSSAMMPLAPVHVRIPR